MMPPSKTAVIGAASVVACLLFIYAAPIAMVAPGKIGVVSVFGNVRPEGLPPGIHMVPFFSKVTRLEMRVQKFDGKGEGSSHDLQTVATELTVNYHLTPAMAPELFSKLGTAYEDIVMSPAVQETFKAVVAQYSAEELITKREAVRDAIKTMLAQKFVERSGNAIILDEVSITNFAFSEAFNTAIENKQVAEQQALKAQRDLERIKIEAEQKVATAEAEAQALKAQKEQVSSELLQLRAIEKWDGHLPQYMSTGSSGALPMIGLPTK